MRVLIVDDSILVRNMVGKLIESFPDYTLAGEAPNGKKGAELVAELDPDLVVMDVNMPVMDGIEATDLIMKTHPVPIIIFTSEDVAEVGYKAIDAGALEVLPKPDIGRMNDSEFARQLESLFSHVIHFGKVKLGLKDEREPLERIRPRTMKVGPFQLVLIGASTGGPGAVRTVLSSLPGDFPLPLMLSQHIQEGFDKGYADWLNQSTDLNVRVAKSSDRLEKGTVLVAPATHHLVCLGNRVIWDDGPRVGNQKPSIDKMFQSAVKTYGSKCLAVLLTGMGRDGAQGCRDILVKGGHTLVQDRESSVIFGMPKAAIELDGASEILPLKEIGPTLIERTSR
jgi:two-component system, chemotaxis family, protein-glutamate methylesterase/glutaminase